MQPTPIASIRLLKRHRNGQLSMVDWRVVEEWPHREETDPRPILGLEWRTVGGDFWHTGEAYFEETQRNIPREAKALLESMLALKLTSKDIDWIKTFNALAMA
jgi:hypothetical protein